ncbi:hypothetical protein G3T36_17360 [Diaminobutyricibacter tongyongensis]|uniref:Uncharacterized protein n=1 Tax=Leifsonia tongyongensis TaxID=1268043 RepID=A0A6L9Y2W5_9MICO|nr:hypothetical protein [Diaminobutyricibacter tongyongensis]NEN07628.1 hypothetical protein [Diaminobutyricibacter tongyongensis]
MAATAEDRKLLDAIATYAAAVQVEKEGAVPEKSVDDAAAEALVELDKFTVRVAQAVAARQNAHGV